MEDPPYAYEPLDNSTDEIRLISIQPYSGSSHMYPIELNLIHAKLSDKPKYEALSYMWGEEDNPKSVEIQGKCFEVGHNLWLALRRLRWPTEERILWVDAICIDQRNVLERNHQVSQMSQVYRQAWRVVAWLGPASLGDTEAIKFFKVLATSSDLQSGRYHTDSEQKLASDFCKLPYWSRLWIIQEVVLAKEIILYCGKDELDWDYFATVIKTQITFDGLSIKESTPTYLVQQRATQKLTEKKQLHFASSSLPELAVSFSEAECREPRDKIFGLLALANDCCQTNTPVDYSMAGFELCQSVSNHHSKSHSPITMVRRLEVTLRFYSLFRTKPLGPSSLGEKPEPSAFLGFFDPKLDTRLQFRRLTGRVVWIEFIPHPFTLGLSEPPFHAAHSERKYYESAQEWMRAGGGKVFSTMWGYLRNLERADLENYLSNLDSHLKDTISYDTMTKQGGVNLALDEKGFLFFALNNITCGDFICMNGEGNKIVIIRPEENAPMIVATARNTKADIIGTFSFGGKPLVSVHHSFVNVVWSEPTRSEGAEEAERQLREYSKTVGNVTGSSSQGTPPRVP